MFNNNMSNAQQGIIQCVDGHMLLLTSTWKILTIQMMTKSNQEADMEVESEELKQSLLPLRTSWMLMQKLRVRMK
jgi:hypothetical protein